MYTCLKTVCTKLEFASSGTCGNKICTFVLYMLNPFYEYMECLCLRKLCWYGSQITRGADKSIARPGRKQATATKLGIYSTYSPWSSIHFLAHCSNFCKPLKKNSEDVRPTRSPRQQWPPRQTKNGHLSILFSVQGTDGSPTGPDPENRVGDKDIGKLGRPFFWVTSARWARALSCKNKTPLVTFPPCGNFPSKCPSIAPAEMSNTPCW